MSELVKLGKPDARSNYKRDLGWKIQDGEYTQHRFYVGRDREKAVARIGKLERLWDAIEAAWREQRKSDVATPLHLGDERPVWNNFTLAVGMALARGDGEVEINPAAELSARAQPHARRTYKGDELCTLWEYASPWERLLIILGLNCGFGAAEIATLHPDEISIDSTHGHYSIHGSFIKRNRFKTGVYGEWMLWPETVRAIEWMKRRRGTTEETALLVSENGRPLNQQTAGGSRNMRIPNTWNTLLKRIRRKDFPTFRKLSFNKLRKTAASFVRRKLSAAV